MKNIHLIATEKPSILYFWGDELRAGDLIQAPDNLGIYNQHIYITSDEEIKDGYYLDLTHNIVMQSVFYQSSDKNGKKIILTTDQDLITNGVQAIDDEFLAWFVNNPSCERVEVKWVKTPDGLFYHQDKVPYGYYKIIIPKEEPKQQYPIGGYAPGTYSCICTTCKNHFMGDKRAVQCGLCAKKQETLEEFSERIAKAFDFDNYKAIMELIIEGAKWQADRLIPEIEKAFEAGEDNIDSDGCHIDKNGKEDYITNLKTRLNLKNYKQ